MASTRDKRSTAGNRLSKVLNEEVEADEFYSTTYGGFTEIENDDDYKSEDEGDDLVDSDFSIEENDEVISDQEEDGSKRKRSLVTRAYKDPKAAKTPGKAEKRKSDTVKAVKTEKKDAKKIKIERRQSLERVERKSSRKATVEKSAETAQKIKERSQVKKKKPLKRNEYYKPTQEELLKEAKVTEQENIKSLERYQKMELEKKKCRIVKKVYTGPTIKYQSVSMPLIEEIKETISPQTCSESEVSIDVVKTEDSDVDVTAAASVNGDVKMEVTENSDENAEKETAADQGDQGSIVTKEEDPEEIKEDDNNDESLDKDIVESHVDKNIVLGPRCERTFITFSDEQTFKAACTWVESKSQPPSPVKICPFTRQKAKYFDPVSQCPYNTIQTFKILRETYYMQLEKAIGQGTIEGVDKEQLNKWMAWRVKEKENKLRRLSVVSQQNVMQNTTTAAAVVQPAPPATTVTAALPS